VIKKSIVSKKGTTESALRSMKKDGLQKILNKAVSSAIKKASKIGS
jgi:pyrroline-5-carboxylate reductase